MTDNEIIKISEEYVRRQCENRCGIKNCEACAVNYVKELVKLSREQQAEIERLQKVIETMTNEQLQFGFETKSEIEKLEYAIDAQATENADLYRETKIAKAEAIKEFAERLKRNHITKDDKGKLHLLIEYDEFDDLKKEMVGE